MLVIGIILVVSGLVLCFLHPKQRIQRTSCGVTFVHPPDRTLNYLGLVLGFVGLAFVLGAFYL